MNVAAINNYQSGFIYNPVSKIKSNDTAPFANDNQAFNPVVNTNLPEQISQTSTTDNNTPKDNQSPPNNTKTQNNSDTTTINGHELTRAEIQLLDELEQIDTDVRQHEMAHITAGGRYITSGASFTYKQGPDGKNYAVGGEVSIDTSPIPGDPQATIQKMRQVKSAALAPASPSAQDIKVASKATQAASKALSDLMILQAKEQADSNENQAFGGIKTAADSYEKVSNLPEESTSSLQIAV
jgi:hypothetical protein